VQVEDLLTQVSDPALRGALCAEVAAIKQRMKFGLVYAPA
jgi:hypothetical protein